MPLTLHIDSYDLRNVDWKKVRFHHARREELLELEKQKQEHNKRSWASKEAWKTRIESKKVL